MKYLGIDYGSKKIGVAISDDGGAFAFPLSIIKSDKESINNIVDILLSKNISSVVIGESVNDKGEKNIVDSKIKNFANELSQLYISKVNSELKVYFEKEWYSSIEARRYDDKYEVDDRAAAIILQRYLDRVQVRANIDTCSE